MQLLKEGFLSAWTNFFVGPWDPSQGLHNPGHHSFVAETAQAIVSRLRVVTSGLWLAPGDSEEVAAALSQALRNCIERALIGLSYLRFGDVFSKYQPSRSEESFRGTDMVIMNKKAETEGFDFAQPSIGCNSFGRYEITLLCLGMMHFHFGHPKQALEVLTEAVCLSQQGLLIEAHECLTAYSEAIT